MLRFQDWNQKLKRSFNETSTLEVLTVMEAGKLLNLSKDEMKLFVNQHGLTKVPISRNAHRYLLLKEQVEDICASRV